MGRITAGIGLISNLPIQDIVEQLIALEARPLTLVQDRIKANQATQAALEGLAAKLLLLGAGSTTFASAAVLGARTAASSHPAVLRATATSAAAVGTHRFRALRQVQTHQLVSGGFADAGATAIGAGVVTIKTGGFVSPETTLAELNGGQGVRRGSIRITDRSGASAVVDVSAALTVTDVVEAINGAAGVRVQAAATGDSLVLTDQTGQTAASLSVQEVAGGFAAADLGILGTASGNTLTGADLVRLAPGLGLSALNDRNGVHNVAGLDDFRITLKNGATIDVNLDNATTVTAALAAINSDSENGGQVTAAIAVGGDRLVLTDQTGGGGTLAIAGLNGSRAATDLGIAGNEQGGGVLTGGRLLAGLGSVLLKSLKGGTGLGTLGQVQLTDRSGATATINLAGASSLADVVAAVNSAGLGISAAVNAAGHGLTLTDTTGAAASNLVVADVGAGTVAADLNIAVNAAVTQVHSGDLNLRHVSESTLLTRLNGGQGVDPGAVKVTDSIGASAVVDLSNAKTVGDAIFAFNTAGVGVTAAINATGDGILLTDIAGGVGSLSVVEQGGTTAADLKIAGGGALTIDGAFRYQVTLDADDTLNDFKTRLAASGAPATASIFSDGSSLTPFRALVTGSRAGQAGRLLVDTGATGLSFSTLVEAADAVLDVGGGAGQVLVTATSNSFDQVFPGLTIDLLAANPEAVTVTVAGDSVPLVDAVRSFVENFNELRSALEEVTAFNPETGQRAVLQADSSALQLEQALFRFVNGTFGADGGGTRQLSQLGISIKDGLLVLDEGRLNARIAADPAGVRQFFETDATGFADRLDALSDAFAGAIDGQLTGRVTALDDDIATLEARADALAAHLSVREELLLNQFVTMERALAQIQSQQSALSQLAQLAQSAVARARG
jgi:flagellar hook-associated protein 2